MNEAIQEADLLIALGMRFDDRVTGKLALYAPQAKKIHIDIDPSELHKNVRADVAIAGDLRTVLRAWLPQVQPARHDAWLARIRSFAGGPTVRDLAGIDDPGPLQAAQVIHDIWRATDGRAVIVTDVGQHQMWTAQYYQRRPSRTPASRRAGWGPWASPCRRRSARSSRGPTARSGPSSATAASR